MSSSSPHNASITRHNDGIRYETCVGWHADAVATARNLGLDTSVVHMTADYSDRLYVRGDLSKLKVFLSFPQLNRGNDALFSPGQYMPHWKSA
jgi:hypothetical protein